MPVSQISLMDARDLKNQGQRLSVTKRSICFFKKARAESRHDCGATDDYQGSELQYTPSKPSNISGLCIMINNVEFQELSNDYAQIR